MNKLLLIGALAAGITPETLATSAVWSASQNEDARTPPAASATVALS